MKMRTMQQIDKLFGPLICFLFSFVRKKNKSILLKESEIKDVLVIKFWGMGSIILFSPAVKMLKDKNPNIKVTLLTLERNVEIANLLQVFDKIIALKLSESHFYVVMFEILKLIKMLRKKVYDIVIDAEFFTRFSALITFFSRAAVKTGFHSWEVYRGNFYDITKPFNRYWHVRNNFLNLFSTYCDKNFDVGKGKVIYPELNLVERDYVYLDEIFKSYNVLEKDRLVCINIHTGDLALERRWPEENFIDECNYTEDVLKKIGISGIINLCGKLSLSQLAVLLKRTKLFITNDSGPLHLADMLEVPTISFFGPETPVLYGANSKNHFVFFKNIDCSPCINVHTGKLVKCVKLHPECMKNITVEEVLDKIKKIL